MTTSTTQALFTTTQIGAWNLNHRVVLAPLTRMRATQPGNIPNALNAEYYAQRASPGGLLIAEATQVCPEGQGYPNTPGIHSKEQVEGWRLVTDAVHARGGLILLQLWHVGRISHSSLQPGGVLPVAPSAIRPAGSAMKPDFSQVPFETPRALELHEIRALVGQYKLAAELAKEAGFDGLEIHSANGYLIDQFLRDRTNQRRDDYGGSIDNRTRFLREVTEAVVSVWGADRVGLRLSPFGGFNDISDSDPVALFTTLLEQLSSFGLAYVHLIEPRQDEENGLPRSDFADQSVAQRFREAYKGSIIVAGGYDLDSANKVIEDGFAQAVAFGRIFISNPDLPERLRQRAPLNPYDRSSFYGGGASGYTDYPSLEPNPKV